MPLCSESTGRILVEVDPEFAADFETAMDGLKITQRVYVFGQGDKETLAARFAKDVCNPAIHNWTIA